VFQPGEKRKTGKTTSGALGEGKEEHSLQIQQGATRQRGLEGAREKGLSAGLKWDVP